MTTLVGELDRIVRTGKLRSWAVLNWPAGKIAEAVDVARANGWRLPAAAQLAYSVLARSPVEDARMVEVCGDANIGVVSSYSLHGGLLSGKYAGSRTGQGRLDDELQNPAMQALVSRSTAFLEVARGAGMSPAQLALAYCLKNPQVSSLLFGARRVEQIHDNLGALELLQRVTDDLMARVRQV